VKTMSRLRRPGAATVAAAVVVLGLVAFILLTTLGGSSGTTVSSGAGNHKVTRDQLASLRVGSSRRDVERRLGKGQDALTYGGFGFMGETGVAVEPMDADCSYYGQAETSNRHALVQLCFRHDKLVSKRTFPAIPGASLG
jgi:hypothetical protein